MDLYGELFARVAWPAWETHLRGRPTLRHLRSLERSQWRSPDELRAIQDRALARLMAHAWANVPHYRALLDERGLGPGAVATVDDLALLPPLTRDAAIRAGDRRKSTASPSCDLTKTTGGTTGEPLRFGYDRGSEFWRQAIKLRGWGWAGYRFGERTFYYWGPATTQTPPLKQRAKVALDRWVRRELYIDCTNRAPDDLDDTIEALRKHNPSQLICYTNAGVDLARRVLERGVRVPRMTVLCCAERLDPRDRVLLTEAFGGEVFETYGCREVMLIGTECAAHDGLHVSMENLIVELLVRDGDRVRAAEVGEVGEVAITDLHNYGMPFVRYLNGDRAVAKSDGGSGGGGGGGGRCSCGRGLARLESVEGRVADTLRDARGEPVCGILFSRIFSWSDALARAVSQWQAVQHADGSVTLRLQSREQLSEEALADLRRSFAKYMRGVPVRTEVVREILPGKNGKRRTVVVEAGGGAGVGASARVP